jgi:hypothetical protein
MLFAATVVDVTDHAWVVIQRAVLRGLQDKDTVHQPHHDDHELEWVADTVADPVIGAIDKATRHLLASFSRRNDSESYNNCSRTPCRTTVAPPASSFAARSWTS